MMTASESTAIRICRVLCIFCMTYVHVNPGLDSFAGQLPSPLASVHGWLSELLGRASVPALSVLGGYLAVAAYGRRPAWLAYARERASVLLLPMVSWNGLILLLSLLIWLATGAQTAVLRDWPAVDASALAVHLDRLTGYGYGSATTALNFLRDLFVCSLLLPLLIMLLRRTGVAGLALLWLLGLTLGFAPLVIRPHILMFFAVGVHLALQGRLLWPRPRVLLHLALALAAVMALVAWLPAYAGNLPGTGLRLLVATGFWLAAASLARFSLGAALARLEPAIYLLFLAHGCVMLLLWGGWQRVFGAGLAGPYLFFYLLAPPLTLLLVLGLRRLLALLPVGLQRLLSGKVIEPEPLLARLLSRPAAGRTRPDPE